MEDVLRKSDQREIPATGQEEPGDQPNPAGGAPYSGVGKTHSSTAGPGTEILRILAYYA